MKSYGELRKCIACTLILGCISGLAMASTPGTNHAREKLLQWENHSYQPQRSVEKQEIVSAKEHKKTTDKKKKSHKKDKEKQSGKDSKKKIQVTTKGTKIQGGQWKETAHRSWVVGIHPQDISMQPVKLTSKEKALLQVAEKYQGVPYHFGGVTPSGFDCSGYTRFVYEKAGIHLPRAADEQYRVGKEIKPSNLRPGDLVFFETYDTGVSHSGIYIGQGRFISATTSGGVKIADMVNGYWAERYIGAKRVM